MSEFEEIAPNIEKVECHCLHVLSDVTYRKMHKDVCETNTCIRGKPFGLLYPERYAICYAEYVEHDNYRYHAAAIS